MMSLLCVVLEVTVTCSVTSGYTLGFPLTDDLLVSYTITPGVPLYTVFPSSSTVILFHEDTYATTTR